MDINASKCLSTGSNPGLGYKVDKDRKFYVDKDEAKIVVEIFQRYARGETKKEIVDDLKRRQIKTSKDNHFDLILNGSDKRLNIDTIPITYIDATLENKESIYSSSVNRLVPPLIKI